MSKKHDLPYIPFYFGDWFKCPEVRALRLDHRALWFDLLGYMWESTERGVMVNPGGHPYQNDEIVRMVGLDLDGSGKWLDLLEEMNVFSRRPDGAIYSRRIVRDMEKSQIYAENGKKGGFATANAKAKRPAKHRQIATAKPLATLDNAVGNENDSTDEILKEKEIERRMRGLDPSLPENQ
jgi:hypothetical protein